MKCKYLFLIAILCVSCTKIEKSNTVDQKPFEFDSLKIEETTLNKEILGV